MDLITEQHAPRTESLAVLNIDCLEHICMYLNPKDLVNIADTCTLTKTAAELAFKRKYRNRKVSLEYNDRKGDEPYIAVHTDRVVIDDLKTCFGILRCFGRLISKLLLLNSRIPTKKLCSLLNHYVIKYCSNSMLELETFNCSECMHIISKTRFPNVKNVSLINCITRQKITKLDECFPNINRLEFDFSMVDKKCIRAHFPHLKHLSIHVGTGSKYFFGKLDVKKALKLNPQLSSIHLTTHRGFSADFLRMISEQFIHLETLGIDDYTSMNFADEMVHFKNVKILNLISNFNLFNLKFNKIPLTFDALKEFVFTSNHGMSDILFDFIENNPSMRKICVQIRSSLELNDIEMQKFVEVSRFIKEINFDTHPFSVDEKDAIFFMNECKSLRKFSFQLKNSRAFNELRECMKNEWQISKCEYNYVTVERRVSPDVQVIQY